MDGCFWGIKIVITTFLDLNERTKFPVFPCVFFPFSSINYTGSYCLCQSLIVLLDNQKFPVLHLKIVVDTN